MENGLLLPLEAGPKTDITGLRDCQWIGGPGNAFCRREFFAASRPRSATLRIVADPHSYAIKHWQILDSRFQHENWLVGGSFVKYRVFVNGTLAAVGPFRPLEDGTPVLQEYDVTALVGQGVNVLAVLSRGEDKGFALILEMESADGQRQVVSSSAEWRQCNANDVYRPVCWECPAIDQWVKGGPGPGEYPEHLDGLVYPQGWRDAGFDDSAWPSAAMYGFAREECEIARTPPYVITRCRPIEITRLAEGNYLIDFSRPVFGGIELSCPSGGGVIELRLAEELQPDGHAQFQLRTENCYQELWNFAPKSEPLAHLGTRMFRYAEVRGWRGPFDADAITAIALGMPFDPTRSAFTCSEGRLEKVWSLCKDSVAHATADIFTDCLTRERLSYEADAYVTMLTHFTTEGSLETARRTLAYLVRHPSWPCEWRQFFIPLFHEYLLQSGDLDFVDHHYAFLRDQTSFHSLMKDGLIGDFPRECIVDWPASERDGFDFGKGNSVANAFAFWDLDGLARIASFLGRDSEAARFADLSAELGEGINRHLYDDAAGLYVDSLGSRHSSLHANMYALRFGLVPENRRAHCLSFIKSRGMACSVFSAQFLLEALFMNGEAEAAVSLMTSEGERSWLEMIRHGAVATTESWLSHPKLNMSWAHPWGSAPANIIVRHLFGLRPTRPGWEDFIFDPQPGGLQRGNLRVTTPRGPIVAKFSRVEAEYHFTVEPDFAPAEEVEEVSGRMRRANLENSPVCS